MGIGCGERAGCPELLAVPRVSGTVPGPTSVQSRTPRPPTRFEDRRWPVLPQSRLEANPSPHLETWFKKSNKPPIIGKKKCKFSN